MGNPLRREQYIDDSVFQGLEDMKSKLIAIKEQGIQTAKSLKTELGNAFQGGKVDTETFSRIAQETRKITEETKQLNATEKELLKLEDKLKQSRSDSIQKNVELKQSIQDQNTINKQYAIINNAANGSIRQLGAELANNKRRYSELSRSQRENEQVGGKLLKQIQQQDKEYKQLQKDIGNTQVNVGNYTQSVKEGIQQAGLFSREIYLLTRAKAALNVGLKAVSLGLKGFSAALVGTGIGAIVAALGLLVGAFLSTQRGADALTSVIRPLKAIFEGLLGFLQDTAFKVFDRLKGAISNPKQAFIDMGNAIKDFALRRIQEFMSGIKGLTTAMNLLFEGDFKKAAKAAVDAGKDLATSLNPVAGLIKDNSEAIKGVFNDIGQAVSKSAQIGTQIDELTKKIENQEIILTTQRAKLNVEYQKQREIAQNQLATDKDRVNALKAAAEAQNKLEALERAFIGMKIKRAKLEASLNDTDRETKLEIAQLEAESIDFEAQAAKKRAGLIALQTGIEKRGIKEIQDAEKKKREEAEKSEKERLESEKNAMDFLEKISIEAQDKFTQSRITLEKESEESLNKLNELYEKGIISKEQKLQAELDLETKFKEELSSIDEQESKDRIKADEKANKKIEEQRKELHNQLADMGIDLANKLANFALMKSQMEADGKISILQDQLDKGKITQEQFEKQRSEILTKQAQKEKQANIAMAIIEGIRATVKAGGLTPLGLLTAAYNAIQIGIMAATPIPKFADGVIDLQHSTGIQGKDSILSLLMPGESVMTTRETQEYKPEFKAMRDGTYKEMIEAKEKKSFAQGMSQMIGLMSQDPKLLAAIKNNNKVDIKNADYLAKAISDHINMNNRFKRLIRG